jgi:hypothetical protein
MIHDPRLKLAAQRAHDVVHRYGGGRVPAVNLDHGEDGIKTLTVVVVVVVVEVAVEERWLVRFRKRQTQTQTQAKKLISI